MTEQQPGSVPDDIDLERPNAARMYDYLLGGGANFAVDRAAAKKLLDVVPTARAVARLNRQFLMRATQFCVTSGVRQFLDLGSGIPTVGNTHAVAQDLDPACRAVYVEHEPVAVSYARHLLQDNANADVVQHDLVDAERLLATDVVRGLLDFQQPVAVMLVAVLHFVSDSEKLAAALRTYVDALAPGSYLCISHVTLAPDPEGVTGATDVYRASSTPLTPRTREEIQALFTGTELVDPGLVFTPEWRPNEPTDVGPNPEESLIMAGVGRKP